MAIGTNYIALGNSDLRNGELEAAIKSFSSVIQFDKSNILAYEGRATAYFRNGDMQRAISDYSHVIAIDPTNANAFLNRGNLYRYEREFDKAINDLSECIRLDSKNSMAYNSRASTYNRKGEFSKAIIDCSKSLDLNPTNDQVLVMRGCYYSQVGLFTNALIDFNEAIGINSNNADAYNGLAWLYATCANASIRNGKGAIIAAAKACKLTAWQKWEYIDTFAAALAESGNFKSAVRYEKQAMSTSSVPNDSFKVMQQHLDLYEKLQPLHEANAEIR